PSTRSSSPCGRRASASVGRKSRPQLLLLVYSWSFSFMCAEKSGSYRPLFLTLKRNLPALIEVVPWSRRLPPLGPWLAGNRPLFLAVIVSAAQETDFGRDHLHGGARDAVF